MPIVVSLVQTADRLVNQLQQNIAFAIRAPFKAQKVGTFSATLTGCTTTVTADVNYATGVFGQTVLMQFPKMLGTSNSVVTMITGLPANLFPKTQQVVTLRIQDNNALSLGTLVVDTTGGMRLYVGGLGDFTSSGVKGINFATVTYIAGI